MDINFISIAYVNIGEQTPVKNLFCPTTNARVTWDICSDINDIHSGGKRKSNKKKKSRKVCK